MKKGRRTKIYALYKGDEFITIGKKKEIAEYMGLTASAISYYHTPAYKKRCKDKDCYILIEIEDSENE